MSRFESSQIEPNTKCLMSSLIDYWAHAVLVLGYLFSWALRLTLMEDMEEGYHVDGLRA